MVPTYMCWSKGYFLSSIEGKGVVWQPKRSSKCRLKVMNNLTHVSSNKTHPVYKKYLHNTSENTLYHFLTLNEVSFGHFPAIDMI